MPAWLGRCQHAARPHEFLSKCTDDAVVPRDSAWFSWFNGSHLVPLEEQNLWRQDLLGLRSLHDNGRLHFGEVPGGHMQFSMEELQEILDQHMTFRPAHELAAPELQTVG